MGPWVVIAAGGALESAFLPKRVFDLRADREVRVSVALSSGARDLVTETALAALTGERVYFGNDQLDEGGAPLHLSWSRADLLVLAPATARLVAECALGIVRCAPTRLFAFAPKDRVVFAPAIHPHMDRRIYAPHVARLRELGCTVLGGDDLFASWSDVLEHLDARLQLRRRPPRREPLLLSDLDP